MSRHFTVLLVEDDEGDSKLLERAFSRVQTVEFNVHRAGSLRKAIEELHTRSVDVILLDLSLPDAHGLDTIRKISEAAPELPVVVLTGLDDEQVAADAQREGAQDYLVKGQVESALLPRIVRYAIERKRTQVELERAKQALAESVRVRTAELLESEERFRLLVEGVEDYAIFMLDPQGYVASWNAGAERTMGYLADEVVGTHFSAFYPPQEREDEDPNRLIERAIRDGRCVREGWQLRKDGSRYLSHTIITPLHSAAGRLNGFSNISRDVTELVGAQQRALQAERLAAIGQMVTGLAHESRNALQRIQSTVNRITRRAGERVEITHLTYDIERATDDIKRLFDEVRAYAAPIILKPKRSSIDEVWRKVWDQLKPLRLSRDATLHDDCGDTNLDTRIDPFRLEQVFRNLFENSFAAADPSIPLEISIRCTEVMHRGESAIRISVQDNGPGLSEEQRRNIFEPFYTTKTSGTGLGMAITKRIIEAHGGQISVGDRQVGAELLIVLPRE